MAKFDVFMANFFRNCHFFVMKLQLIFINFAANFYDEFYVLAAYDTVFARDPYGTSKLYP